MRWVSAGVSAGGFCGGFLRSVSAQGFFRGFRPMPRFLRKVSAEAPSGQVSARVSARFLRGGSAEVSASNKNKK